MTEPSDSQLLDGSVEALLARLAAGTASPGSGSLAALAVASAAALVAMAARRAEEWAEGPGTVAQAELLRRRAALLVDADAEALAVARALLDGGGGDRALGEALDRAAAIPLETCRLAADVCALAAAAAPHAGDAQADAAAAAAMAAGAARAAAHLVEINLAMVGGDERVGLAADCASWAAESADEAFAAAAPDRA